MQTMMTAAMTSGRRAPRVLALGVALAAGLSLSPIEGQAAWAQVRPGKPAGQQAAPTKPPAPGVKEKPITTGSQQASLVVTTHAGACPCTNCTLRAGRSVISFEYDPDKKGDLDAQGKAAMAAASRQSVVDVAAQARAPGLCASDLCTPQNIVTSTVPANTYGGASLGQGSTNSRWQITGACVDNRKYEAVPDHPTISLPGARTIEPVRPMAGEMPPHALALPKEKPSYISRPVIEEKPSYSAPAPALKLPEAKPPVLSLPAKPAPSVVPGACPAGQKRVVIAGKSVCSGAAAAVVR